MTENDYNNLKLLQLRMTRNLSQEDVANNIGVSRFTIIRAEKGQAASWKLLQTLSAFYGIAISELLQTENSTT